MDHKNGYLSGPQISPQPIHGEISVVELIENSFLAYNAARLKEACHLFVGKMLHENVTIGLSLTGALTPAGLGVSAIIPLIKNGLVDYIVSTGANLYHDTHFGLNLPLYKGSATVDDRILKEKNVIRIYDIFFEFDVLLDTDSFYRKIIQSPEFQKPMSSADFHFLCGKFLLEREKVPGILDRSFLAAAFEYGVPIYTSSFSDSSIGMNVAEMMLKNRELQIDPLRDVNETAAIVYNAKSSGGRSAVMIMGGGSPKNFLLQTEPYIQEILGLNEKGHDYFLQITDARPDTGGLSGATPNEAVSWGKIDPGQLPDSVVCYLDTTVALPLLTAYALAKKKNRPYKRLIERKDQFVAAMQQEYLSREKEN
ncbi:MAG TPA: deoxyhypusine synthase [Bacteroidetes bacterium]|nr:deoxyhypusine synthase [Bacteroidota bacterium]